MDIEDLKVTAALAHLNLEQKELEAAFPAFEQVLGFFAAMQAADGDTESFPPGEGSGSELPAAASSYLRTDILPPADTAGTEAILEQAGDRDGRFVVIPNVL